MTETPSTSLSAWPEDMRTRVLLVAIYSLAVPLVLGLISGINEAGTARMISKEAYIARYVVRGVLSWWTSIAVMFALVALLRPWKPSFLLVLILVPPLVIFLNAPLSLIWQPLFEPYLADGAQFYPLWPWQYGDPDYLQESAFALLTNEIVWVSFNLIFQRSFQVPLYGFPPRTPQRGTPGGQTDAPSNGKSDGAAGGESASTWSAFTDRLPKDIGTDIVALEAQEHYTKVYTRLGSALVLHRFGDSVKAMDAQTGLQVHRSFWVRTDAVASIDRSGRTYDITLDTGLKVPVSRSYKVRVDELNIANNTAQDT